EVVDISEHEITITTPKGNRTFANDFVIALTGYRPNFKFLTDACIQLSDDAARLPKYNSETLETNISGLYLAGVICGGLETHKWFIENSRIHAKLIAEHIET